MMYAIPPERACMSRHLVTLTLVVIRGIAECRVDCRSADERSERTAGWVRAAANGAIVQVN